MPSCIALEIATTYQKYYSELKRICFVQETCVPYFRHKIKDYNNICILQCTITLFASLCFAYK